MKEMKVLSPTAILGYGFPEESFKKGMDLHPDVIAVDAGSTDPGPYYLGAGVSFTDRVAVKRDLTIMIKAALNESIPVIVGTAGGSGADIHLNWCVDIVREIMIEYELSAKVAVISAEINKDIVEDAFENRKIESLDFVPELTRGDIDRSTAIVAQMGMGPIIKALKSGADIIIAGRCYDPAVFAALPVMKGYEQGLALHMGKILECAAIAADPGSGSDCMMGLISKDCFRVFPLNESRKCTIMSVAAHTLYEKSNPNMLHGPDGIIDLRKCEFNQVDERTVEVRGTDFIPSEKPLIKLEGAKRIGYRTISIAGVRDPVMIAGIDGILDYARETVSRQFRDIAGEYTLTFRIYGKNGVMGENEPTKQLSHELGIIIDAVGRTQEDANSICSFTRSTLLHYGYEGRISTAGNLAFPYSPSDLKAGEVYEFCIYHLMPLKQGMFEVKWMEDKDEY